ncbi:hypothetical protein ACFV1C_00240 [Streptomyces sp. NPDC059605]|uniref:hypothetical protein n=1 Tax=Streptomyces sp. NPDC059605 TaxID=3346882 RepID=UPI00367A8651
MNCTDLLSGLTPGMGEESRGRAGTAVLDRPTAADDKPSVPGQRIPAKVPEQPIRNQHAGCGRGVR